MTSGEVYTDSNGRRLMKRVRNLRKSWNLTLTEPVASNYYPVTSAAVILGNRHRVTVLTDRPQGAASLADGEVEIMVSHSPDHVSIVNFSNNLSSEAHC